MNIGGSEFLIIAGLALLLFGPSLLAFWFGYVLGQRKGEDVHAGVTEVVTGTADAAATADADASAPSGEATEPTDEGATGDE